ncbi:MAG: gliding motility protein GldN [Flavobacteriales bacterium]|nr:gliding motility protein GldN [Flavobacteriales bacterium]
MRNLSCSFFFFSFLITTAQYCHPGTTLEGIFKMKSSQFSSIPYPYLREADVMWSKRVWRVIDMREKINHTLYFPVEPIPSRVSFMQMVMNSLTCNATEYQVTPYDVIDDEFTTRLTREEVIEKAFTKEEISFENDLGEIESKTVDNPFDFSSVKRLRIKEDWFFDNQRSVFDVRIIGVCPVVEKFDEMGEYKGEQPLVWLYFPELRMPMSITSIFNPRNDASTITYDHLFMKRIFSSYIFKESNVYDRKINSYKKGLDLLLESKRIENVLFNYEQDLWEY